jgi:hypothetical protein
MTATVNQEEGRMEERVIVNIIENALKGLTPSERMRRTMKAAVRVNAAKVKKDG